MPKTTPKKADTISIVGAKAHNLKNISVDIPRNKLVVITGVSGSGKSSLAFDTLFAEGQRRYVESLSAYARQFLGKLDKPQVDSITGISPAIAIEQKTISRNPRSTVGTTTEVYDYLRILFARAGRTYSPVSGEEVKRHKVADVIDYLNKHEAGTKAQLLAPFNCDNRDLRTTLELLGKQGFSRVRINSEIVQITDALNELPDVLDFELLIDRIVVDPTHDDNNSRISDSVQTAFFEGEGKCIVEVIGQKVKRKSFSNIFELDGITFERPSPNFFSFNTPLGACKQCEGFGSVIGIDPELVIPNKGLSVYENAIVCWKGDKMSKWKDKLIATASEFGFPVHRPIHELTAEQQELLWTGNKHFRGINAFFKYVEKKQYKIQYRVMLSRYRGKTPCPECNGNRIRKDASYVKIGGKSISELLVIPIAECLDFFKNLSLNKHDAAIAKRLLIEITNRLQFLCDVGLGYLTLNRAAATLSGGESQRINLATSLGSSLVGSMYILDEPSIGLHSRDTERLIGVLESLRDLGNTVVVVEHDEDIMNCSDRVIDMGPEAGTLGGEVIFAGDHNALMKEEKSLTARYLTQKEEIPVPSSRRKWKDHILITGARENNLQSIDVKIPLGVLVVVTGVSGSGKSTLVKSILYPALTKHLGGYGSRVGDYDTLDGSFKRITDVEFIDQNPIGKSSRSNPVTYVKAYDEIRNLYAKQQVSKVNGYKPKHFSFNVEGGRCEMCQGEGEVTVEMQFMADIKLKCESCHGKRFKDEVLEVTYREKSIADILDMTIDEAIAHFEEGGTTYDNKVVAKLMPLQDVGLGYVALGQSSSTLSGGEAQRIKLASFLGKERTEGSKLFIFDEPTTGLHFHDIRKLLAALNALIKQGHSIVIIEHNMEIIKCADWLIDLGPEGGEAGGKVVFEGTPEELVNCKESYTAEYLKGKLR